MDSGTTMIGFIILTFVSVIIGLVLISKDSALSAQGKKHFNGLVLLLGSFGLILYLINRRHFLQK